jgi:23S rRNA (uracil1939-C5)-methyltransferase
MGTQQKMVRGPVILGDLHSSGRCTAHVNGKPFYLDGGIPGEKVTYTLQRRKQAYRVGRVEDVVDASLSRVPPSCRHHDTCGGCPWQHMDYDLQLNQKRNILTRALQKYGIVVPDIPPVIPAAQLTGYRHRMEYAFSAFARYGDGRPARPGLGFHKTSETGTVTGITECFLQADPSRRICDFAEELAQRENIEFYNPNKRTGFLRSVSIRLSRNGNTMVTFGFSHEPEPEMIRLLSAVGVAFPEIASLCYTVHPSPAHGQMHGIIIPFPGYVPYIHESLGGRQFRIHAASFFQPHAVQAEAIFSTICAWADLHGTELVYDLYSGVGTIALSLAPRAGRVIGIEGSVRAIDDANENARLNATTNVSFFAGDILETFHLPFIETHGKPDLIVLDPPRPGTLIEIKKTINASGAGKVIYLSCNPVSLAFDLKQLTEEYRVTRIQPFDMLPRTQHLETLVMMERRE